MKERSFVKRWLLVLSSLILLFSTPNAFAASTSSSTNYDDIHFPQWVRDVRRTEIITFGSLPFVTLWTTVGYSLGKYGKFKNPLDKSTSSFTEDDQWNIIAISAATCVGLGLTDLTINLILRSQKQRRLRRQNMNQAFTVMTPSQMERENMPPMREDETDEQALERLKRENEMEARPNGPNQEIFSFGVESALF